MERKKNKPHRDQLCNNVYLDNKLQYEKNASKELQSAEHDHPLKVKNDPHKATVQDLIDLDGVTKEMESVALDWKSFRNTTECSCSLSLDQISKKVK